MWADCSEQNQEFKRLSEEFLENPRGPRLSVSSFLPLPFERLSKLQLLLNTIIQKASARPSSQPETQLQAVADSATRAQFLVREVRLLLCSCSAGQP